MILALDTSTESAGLALYEERQLLAEVNWRTGRAATAQTLPLLEQCLRLQGYSPADLTGIGVALGPGSFNSLRVGLSLAKGLAYALGVPLVGVSTLEVVAYPFSSQVLPVCAVLRAGRKRIIWGIFQTQYGRWQQTVESLNTTPEELVGEVERSTILCGEIGPSMAAFLRERLGKRALIAPPALASRRAGYLAELAWNRFQEDPAGDDLAALQPIYLSRPRIGGAPLEKENS
ncbi:MAG: tRNA (adenosine(37)-N6)-threonylcarbamoyltransferase complex dimerization subunit type 1 TsaB [Chloroflexia bacterium]|nr:tRNA (adenosine(37)-N6)-threonylcarbamoyltransferase complex dimerization subunit type 1 TsaB [Chloroflexia bacterium]